MSGAEALLVIPIVLALVSAFNDGTELGQKTRTWWKNKRAERQKKKKGNAQGVLDDEGDAGRVEATEQELNQSLVVSPQRIRQRFNDGVGHFGQGFGDALVREDLTQCLLSMYRDMLRTTQLMLDQRLTYDPARLLRASDQTRESALESFDRLSQRLLVQAPIRRNPRYYGDEEYEIWHTLPRRGKRRGTERHASPESMPIVGVSRVQTLESFEETDTETAREQDRMGEMARRYADAMPIASPGPSPQHSPIDYFTERNAFCPGPVEEGYSAETLSMWLCYHCGTSISFDYHQLDCSKAFRNFIFSCHLPVRSETAQYKCIICRSQGLLSAVPEAYGKMDLIAHLSSHTPAEFEAAGFDAKIRDNSIPEL